MSKLLFSALKIFLLLALALAVGIGALLLADHEGWPRWIVAVAVAGAFTVLVLVLLLRRYYFRRRESRFVRRVVAQDLQAIDAAPTHERRQLLELQERWNKAVATLRGSRLRHRGDPLYTLPWFMIFGETASGKSTAVSHARLTSILSDAGPTKGIASTRNCDWWFFERAVILDTAGRYAVPLESGDGDEWERFLVLLAKYRRKEPLNGLIVTLPADRLLNGDRDQLHEYGRSIRLRIDQLMRVLGAKFPVYVLVTKMDLVMGMAAMAELLPEEQRGQAMGLLSDSDRRAPEEFVDQALGHIARRLKDLRLLLGAKTGSADGGRAALFPDEFERLAPRIKAFVEGAFAENPYQETPFLRGFFISSGRQSGLVTSGVLNSLNSLKECRWRLPDTGLGLFLHDFFDAILPRDRAGFRPLPEYLSWRAATGNLALGAWLLLLLTGIGLASLSYVQISEALRPAQAHLPQAPVLGESLAQDMITLGLMRDQISKIDQRLHHRIWPRMGYQQGQEALTGLRRQYINWFRDAILDPTDRIMGQHFATLDAGSREALLGPYLEYLVWRIDTLKAREEGHPRSDRPGQEPAPLEALAIAFGGQLPYVAAFFPDMYRSYAIWEQDTAIISRERREMQVWANRLVYLEGKNLYWLVEWADNHPELPDPALGDFWPGHAKSPIPPIPGAYTVQGKAKIKQLLARMARAALEPAEFAQREAAFWGWYRQQFYEHWLAFARNFHRGAETLSTRREWQQTGTAMATPDNPYFRLLTTMDEEFKALQEVPPQPPIRSLVGEFVRLTDNYRAGQRGVNLEQRLLEKVEQLEVSLALLEKSLEKDEQFTEYLTQLDTFLPATASVEAAYNFARQHYGRGGGDQASPVDEALAALQALRQLLEKKYGRDEVFWDLLGGPLNFLVTLASREAACGLNNLWEADVLGQSRNVPPGGLWEKLFGSQGVVNDFLAGPARPFLQRSRRGWAANAWVGVPFPFEQPFLNFINEVSVPRPSLQEKYNVNIATLPTNVNREARSEPFQTSLTLECNGQSQQLDNYNFPASLDFVWQPQGCNRLTLEIHFREATLRKSWPGERGFRDFLRQFSNGRQVYTPADFPAQRNIMEGLGVEMIQINYRLQDAEPVLAIRDYPPISIPDQPARCWSGVETVSRQEPSRE